MACLPALVVVVLVRTHNLLQQRKMRHVAFRPALSRHYATREYARLNEGDAATLYLVFSPSCPVSADAASSWRERIASWDFGMHRIIGVVDVGDDLESVASFVDRHGLDFPTVRTSFDALEVATGIYMVPSVLVVDPNGVPAFIRQGGTVTDEVSDSIVRAMNGNVIN